MRLRRAAVPVEGDLVEGNVSALASLVAMTRPPQQVFPDLHARDVCAHEDPVGPVCDLA
jgi:hypothetical protein